MLFALCLALVPRLLYVIPRRDVSRPESLGIMTIVEILGRYRQDGKIETLYSSMREQIRADSLSVSGSSGYKTESIRYATCGIKYWRQSQIHEI